MKKFKFTLYILPIMVLLYACTSNTEVTVSHSGALMDIMSGNIDATISLKELEAKDHVYALGALKDLQGEIQIFDGEVFVSKTREKNLEILTNWEQEAALLVYASVNKWIEIEIPPDVLTYKELEVFIKGVADSAGVPVEKPFPFLVNGAPKSLDWHVINWDVNDKVHTHEKHQNSGLKDQLQNINVDILGFYSEEHIGVFTHHTTYMHLHFKTKEGDVAGHVDDLNLSPGMKLKLPLSN